MAKEIERKYLVDRRKWNKRAEPTLWSFVITQGYLTKSPSHSVRVRIKQGETGEEAYLTIKGKLKGITRDEFEYRIPLDDARVLIKMCEKEGLIEKTRHVVGIDDLSWEVDEFRGINRGLLVAEIELKEENQAIDLPNWIGREVTHDKRYTNAYLSNHKAPLK